eukprot:g6768.t1
MSGWKVSHVRFFSYIKQLVNLNQNHNPERLGKCFLVNVPWIFQGAWAVIRPWIDQNTAAKITLNPTEVQLHAVVDPRDLEQGYPGGLHEPYPVPNLPGVRDYSAPEGAEDAGAGGGVD